MVRNPLPAQLVKYIYVRDGLFVLTETVKRAWWLNARIFIESLEQLVFPGLALEIFQIRILVVS